MLKGTSRELAAEFLGTFVLLLFGIAVVAQVVLSGRENGEYLSINIGWGLAVTMGVYVAGGVSGAHLNPAVTLALAVHRGFPWSKVIPYILVQVAAALLASLLVYVTYQEALDAFVQEHTNGQWDTQTASIWATYPAGHLSTFPGGLIDQIVGTAMLLMCIFAVSDSRNIAPQANVAPLVVGSIVFLIGMTFGYNCGYAINPARDFGPRLFTYFAGWGDQVFTADNHFWWVPIVGPMIGGVLGGWVYDLLIENHHPEEVVPAEA
jgi:glycerol uptake facilitator protein